MRHKTNFLAILLACVFAMPYASADDGFTLEMTEKEPPEEIADEMRALLEPKSYAIGDADGVFYEFWFTKEWPVTEEVSDSAGALPKIPEMAFLGAAKIHREGRHDFRDDPFVPGVYTMRMALQPIDGNHIGTAPFDTFFVLIHVEKDQQLDMFYDHEEMIEIASEEREAFHPPILSLQPVDAGEEGDQFPRLDVGRQDWDVLVMKMPVKWEGGGMEIPIHIVFRGIGHL